MLTRRFAYIVQGRVPLTTCGKIWNLNDIEEAYSQGADLIAVGKVGIALPDWPMMIQNGSDIQNPPFSKQHLRDVALSEVFVDYMCNYDNFVKLDSYMLPQGGTRKIITACAINFKKRISA